MIRDDKKSEWERGEHKEWEREGEWEYMIARTDQWPVIAVARVAGEGWGRSATVII